MAESGAGAVATSRVVREPSNKRLQQTVGAMVSRSAPPAAEARRSMGIAAITAPPERTLGSASVVPVRRSAGSARFRSPSCGLAEESSHQRAWM
jgi:hypothetical protein